MRHEDLQKKLDNVPTQPGVYVFLGKDNATLYVGKARNLRSRVRSYFQEGRSDVRPFIDRLHRELEDIETFVVATEKEAVLLENSVIKTRKPRYNFKLRDDKEFLHLYLNLNEPWPKLRVTRNRKDQGLHFGPYDSATAARSTLRSVNRHFRLRTCRDTEFENRVRPCLQHQIGRCDAPCVLPVDPGQYAHHVKLVRYFLEGRYDDLDHELTEKMQNAAHALRYEQAAQYRDQLRALHRVREKQRITLQPHADLDAIAVARDADAAEIAVVSVRHGRIQNIRTYPLKSELPDDELLLGFVSQYYRERPAPSEVLVEIVLPEDALLDVATGATITTPKRGPKESTLSIARENALHALRDRLSESHEIEQRLLELQQLLRLTSKPVRIECVDISHTGGSDTVGSISVLVDGVPSPKHYRSFSVRSVADGDDFGAMYEVLRRRVARANERDWALPDILIVDGGQGQLDVALRVVRELNVTLPVVGLAKERKGQDRVERLFFPGQKNPVALPARGAARNALVVVRDEAHRTSNRLRTQLAKNRNLRSGLLDIPGIGKKTSQLLLRKLGSLRAVKVATEEELRELGLTATQRARLIEWSRIPAPQQNEETDSPPAEENDVVEYDAETLDAAAAEETDALGNADTSEDEALANAFVEEG